MMRLRAGTRLGKYRLERKLGQGGSAVVWRARDTVEQQRVAVKIMPPAVVDEFGRKSIEAEARIAARLHHPRIVRLRNADWVDGCFLLVTDLARRSLDAYPGARRSVAIATSILADVAEGLAHAHALGLLHRDIKPGNILLFDDRRAKLADFGTARPAPARTRVLTDVGTFGYMAPEQAYGRPRFASDVFSLALTAYELYAGELPGWPFEWPLAGSRRFASRCPAPIQEVLRVGLDLELARRWRDGIEFHEAIARAVEQTELPSPSRRGGRSRGRGPLPVESDPFRLESDWFRRSFGDVLETHFDCHACDGPLSESMSHCPWCGSSRNSFIDVTRYPLVCPDCERGVRPEWGACPTCATGRFESDGRPVPGTATAARRCARKGCGAPIHRFMRYCPACKRKQARPWKVEGLPPCERCRWPMAPRWRFCGWCGRKNRSAMAVSPSRTPRRPVRRT